MTNQYTEPVGRSQSMQTLREEAKRLAQHDAWILLTGEPGSGKQTMARFIHESSPRSENDFIAVAVGSIAGENSAVELFGSEEGDKIHYGLLEQASGGTLFLDQVEDMDSETQTRLLSALQESRFLRIGGTEPIEVNVRVIAANSHDLADAVQEGRFREELYYRLNVVPLFIPPLRAHSEDVPELLALFIDQAADQNHLPYKKVNTAALNQLRQHHWPGNVLELRNLVQRLLIQSSDEEIGEDDVESALGQNQLKPKGDISAVVSHLYDLPLKAARESFEKAYLEHHLKQAGGSVAKIADPVGMDRTNLYRKLRTLDIDPKKLTSE